MSLPSFIPLKINSNKIYEQFCLIKLDKATSFKAEEHCYFMDAPSADSSQRDTSPIEEPNRTNVIYSEYKALFKLCSGSCLSNEEIWLTSEDSVIRLYNLREENVSKSIHTKSGSPPKDIAVTSSGDLVYTDYTDRTVNIVKNTNIHTVIDCEDGALSMCVSPPLVTFLLLCSVTMNELKLYVSLILKRNKILNLMTRVSRSILQAILKNVLARTKIWTYVCQTVNVCPYSSGGR